MFWNEFGDLNRSDPFHEATKLLLAGPSSPASGAEIPFSLDAASRITALNRVGAFDCIEHQTSEWSLTLDPGQTAALYATYSNINIREDRAAILTELARIAREQFQGKVIRNMVTSLYIARRKP